MPLRSLLLLTSIAASTSGCSTAPRSKPAPGAKVPEMKLTYTDPAAAQKADEATSPEIISTTTGSQETLKSGSDGSEIKTMFDGFGNKTETRSFWNNELIQRLIVRTSKDGQKTGFVYGYNGDVRTVPPAAFNDMMNIAPNALAKAVGISEGRRVEIKPLDNGELPATTTIITGPLVAPSLPKTVPEASETRPQTAAAVLPKPVDNFPSIVDDLRRKVQIPVAKKTLISQ